MLLPFSLVYSHFELDFSVGADDKTVFLPPGWVITFRLIWIPDMLIPCLFGFPGIFPGLKIAFLHRLYNSGYAGGNSLWSTPVVPFCQSTCPFVYDKRSRSVLDVLKAVFITRIIFSPPYHMFDHFYFTIDRLTEQVFVVDLQEFFVSRKQHSSPTLEVGVFC